MERNVFIDLIDALGKVTSGLKVIANLAKSEREKIRQTLDKTYLTMDTTSNTNITQLRSRLD